MMTAAVADGNPSTYRTLATVSDEFVVINRSVNPTFTLNKTKTNKTKIHQSINKSIYWDRPFEKELH